MKRLILLSTFFCIILNISAQEQQVVVPYTLADRDRVIRIEARMETLESRMSGLEKRMDDLQTQMNRIETTFDNCFMWGFGMVLMSIFGLVGFIVYDRRTTLAPVEGKTERIIKALRERAEKDPVLMEALKNTALW